MISKKYIFIILAIASVALTVPWAPKSLAQLPPSSEIARLISEEEVRKFMADYINRFMKLELGPFMDLFSKEAIENRMLPYADIQQAFRKTITRSKSIIYHLQIYSIHTYSDGAAVTGHYKISQSFKGAGKKHLEGDIQWDLVLESDSLKIREVNYGRKR